MEKKSCKFSITQFEYELEPYNEELESKKEVRKWESSEVEFLKKYFGVLNQEDLSKMLKRSPQELVERWRLIKQDKPVQEQKSEPVQVPVPEKKQRKKREPKKEAKPEKAALPLKQKKEPQKKETQKKETKKKEPQKKIISDAWERNLESFINGERSTAVFNWITYNRKQYKSGKLPEDKFERLQEINFFFFFYRTKRTRSVKAKPEKSSLKQEKKKKGRKSSEAWNVNYDSYCKGERSNAISTWIAYNRKQYKTGELPEEKFEKLMTVNFPFDVVKKRKPDKWDKQLEEWKKGERKSIYIQRWRQRSIRQYLDGKLSGDRIIKLKEVGILK
jgi:hypothetical protein